MLNSSLHTSRSAKKLACPVLLLFGAIFAWYQSSAQTGDEARINRVINGLRLPVAIKGQPPATFTLANEMSENHVPGVSIAVVDNGRIAWARGFGIREAGSNSPVTPETLFEAQSISKAVTTTACLRLVISGKLSLDKPVNEYLKSWKIPPNEYQDTQQVTLRRILSHSSGLTVGGFEGYRYGDSIPTLLQILNGQKPANNPPIRVDFTPGSRSRYSGGGMEVLQQLLIDVTGQSFPNLMQHLVLTPSGMKLSTFQQPLPRALWADAATGHDSDGNVIRGKWPIHPEMAAGGLWTTPEDLARWAIEVSQAWNGTTSKLLSRTVATEMLTVQMEPYGLGVELQGAGTALEFSHAGSNHGFRAMLVMFPAVGKGAVIMANGDRADGIISNLITAIATEYGWPGRTQTERESVSLSAVQRDALLGVYSLPAAPTGESVTFEVTQSGNQLYGQFKGLGPRAPLRLFPASATNLFSPYGLEITFSLDASGKATTLQFGQIVGKRVQ